MKYLNLEGDTDEAVEHQVQRRGMIINTSALVYGVVVGVKRYEIKSNFRYLITCFIVFVVLFVSSVFIVNSLRAVKFSGIQAE